GSLTSRPLWQYMKWRSVLGSRVLTRSSTAAQLPHVKTHKRPILTDDALHGRLLAGGAEVEFGHQDDLDPSVLFTLFCRVVWNAWGELAVSSARKTFCIYA